MLRVATNNDADLAPLFFPLGAGWVDAPPGIELVPGTVGDGIEGLLQGQLDVAMVGPLIYANNQDKLLIVPTPVRAPDMATDSIFIISNKRLDKVDRPRVSCSAVSSTGAAILRVISGTYYQFDPDIQTVESDTVAIRTLQSGADMCVVSGEVGMRAAGPASAKGYFVEDLTRAWWIMTGQPLPVGLFAVRRQWVDTTPEANALVRSMMIMWRAALQKSKEQITTVADKEERRTGLPVSALLEHYNKQRYELNEAHLRGLLEFYRRAAVDNLAPTVATLQFFPSSIAAEPAPATPPRRVQPEAARRPQSGDNKGGAKSTGATSRAQEKGLRVIKGGKDKEQKAEDGEQRTEGGE